METISISHQNYLITTDRELLQPAVIHHWLSTESYWAQNIPYEVVKTSFDHSFVIGALYNGQQIAYARLITDYATFAYLADVYVTREHRGQGISKKMLEILLQLDWVQQLRRLMLATLDAHGLYESFGFTPPKFPVRLMEITRPNMYEKPAAATENKQS